MKLILINWKWLPISPVMEDDEPDLIGSPYVNEIVVGEEGDRLVQINLQREEAEFEDEYEELYDERNELLHSLVGHYQEKYEVVVFLHKNAPHYYGDYDVKWFEEQVSSVKVETFGGGEDFLYDLHNPASGLLDQVGNFSPQALMESGGIKQAHFDGIWKHYCDQQASGSTEDAYTFYRSVMEQTLPVFQESLSQNLLDQVQAFLDNDKAMSLTEEQQTNLERLVNVGV